MATILEKNFTSPMESGLGEIGIRVVVFAKKDVSQQETTDQQIMDLEGDESFSSSDAEINSFLESPKGGRLCCVFLINGQRHHGLDNTFIVNDLKMKYLRKRMVIVVDLDKLSQRAIAQIMQGSRSGFYEGDVYKKICERVSATLQNDPDLMELEEEAEEELAHLRTGDAVVQEALDQLIESHFSIGDHAVEGAGEATGKQGVILSPNGKATQTTAIAYGESGEPSLSPVLVSDHPAMSLRLRPNVAGKLTVTAAPESAWQKLEDIELFVHNAVPGLTWDLKKQNGAARIQIQFAEPPGFDQNDYPIETGIKVVGRFKDNPEVRVLEKVLSIKPPTRRPPPPPRILKEIPTYLKVSGHQPIRLISGGADTHVRVIWDGKDEIAQDPTPQWKFSVRCASHPNFPTPTLTRPTNGRFEILVQTPVDWLIGTKLEFEIQASGPNNQVLSTLFAAEVVPAPGPTRVDVSLPVKGQRRPPYKLLIVSEQDFSSNTRWGSDTWDKSHAGAFIEPKEKDPLTLCINQDFGLLRSYIDGLIAKRADEGRTEEKKTKYISHVAFHLYQMYLAKENIQKQKEAGDAGAADLRILDDEEMQQEINRVASTLVRLMEVMR